MRFNIPIDGICQSFCYDDDDDDDDEWQNFILVKMGIS